MSDSANIKSSWRFQIIKGQKGSPVAGSMSAAPAAKRRKSSEEWVTDNSAVKRAKAYIAFGEF